jgi:glutamate carboxypeptidase
MEPRLRNSGRTFVWGAAALGAVLSCAPHRAQPAPPGSPLPALLASRAPAFDRQLLEAAQERRSAYVRDLATLVNIDSGTDDAGGLSQVGEVLVQRLKEIGAAVEVLAIPPAAGKVVRGTFEGTGRSKIMLMAHFDTVFARGEAAHRPFRVEDNRALGPGVADAKGGVTLVLHALDVMVRRGFRNFKTLTVLFNPDEETGSLGSHRTIRELSAKHDYVLSYEPPDAERVIVGTKGVAYVHLLVKGRASHAGAAPEKGRNAAIELSHQVLQLKDLGDATKGTTVNWTVLRSGDRINIIPDQASATGDMRILEMSEIGRVQKDADNLVRKHFVPDTEVTVNVEGRRPAFAKNPRTDKLALLAGSVYRELNRSIEPVTMGYGTDAGFAFDAANVKPAVLEGLGIVGGGLHAPEEWADLDSVAPRLYLTVRMLELLGEATFE